MKKIKFCRYGTLNAYRNSRGQWWSANSVGCYHAAPERADIYCFPYGYIEPYIVPFSSFAKKHTKSYIAVTKKDFHVFYIDENAEIYTHLGKYPNRRILSTVGNWNLIKAKDLEYFLKQRKNTMKMELDITKMIAKFIFQKELKFINVTSFDKNREK